MLDKALLRREGQQRSVMHLVYCSAIVIPEGAYMMLLGMTRPPQCVETEDNGMVVHTLTPEKGFCNDLDEPAPKLRAIQLKPFSYKTFYSKLTYVRWRDIPSTGIYCSEDQAIPISPPKSMVAEPGAQSREETLDASHSPFLSMPDKVAATVRRAAGESTFRRMRVASDGLVLDTLSKVITLRSYVAAALS